MKLNKHIFAISLGTAMFVAMVIVVSMISVPMAANTGGSGEKTAPIILASAPIVQASAQSNMAAAGAAQPQSIPVPCPIWILGQIMGYGKTASQSADGAPSSPKLVPGGIWLMQKFSEAAGKTL